MSARDPRSILALVLLAALTGCASATEVSVEFDVAVTTHAVDAPTAPVLRFDSSSLGWVPGIRDALRVRVTADLVDEELRSVAQMQVATVLDAALEDLCVAGSDDWRLLVGSAPLLRQQLCRAGRVRPHCWSVRVLGQRTTALPSRDLPVVGAVAPVTCGREESDATLEGEDGLVFPLRADELGPGSPRSAPVASFALTNRSSAPLAIEALDVRDPHGELHAWRGDCPASGGRDRLSPGASCTLGFWQRAPSVGTLEPREATLVVRVAFDTPAGRFPTRSQTLERRATFGALAGVLTPPVACRASVPADLRCADGRAPAALVSIPLAYPATDTLESPDAFLTSALVTPIGLRGAELVVDVACSSRTCTGAHRVTVSSGVPASGAVGVTHGALRAGWPDLRDTRLLVLDCDARGALETASVEITTLEGSGPASHSIPLAGAAPCP